MKYSVSNDPRPTVRADSNSSSLSSASAGSSTGRVTVSDTPTTARNPSADGSPVTMGNITVASISG